MAQLKTLATNVNSGTSYDGYYVKLGNDIDLSEVCSETGSSWKPIGTRDSGIYAFKGSFDGDNHEVSGLYIKGKLNYLGLFGYVGEGGSVANLSVSGTILFSGTDTVISYFVGGVYPSKLYLRGALCAGGGGVAARAVKACGLGARD